MSIEEPKDTLARLIAAGVRPIIAVSSVFRPIRKVLIAYSGSMESAKARSGSCSLRLWPDVKLRIVTFQSSEDRPVNFCMTRPSIAGLMDSLLRMSRIRISQDFLLPIATYWQADMIVLGNSARNLL